MSRLHWKVEPVSLEEKPKLAEALFTVLPEAGPEVMVVSGAVVSTVQVRLAGVPSVWPAASVALTWKVCEPSERSVLFSGEVQGV